MKFPTLDVPSWMYARSYQLDDAKQGRELETQRSLISGDLRDSRFFLGAFPILGAVMIVIPVVFLSFQSPSWASYVWGTFVVLVVGLLMRSLFAAYAKLHTKLKELAPLTRTPREKEMIDDPINQHAVATARVADLVNKMIEEWNHYHEGVRLGQLDPRLNAGEIDEWIAGLREKTHRQMQIANFYEQHGKRAKLPSNVDIVEALGDLDRASVTLDALREIEPVKPSPLLLDEQRQIVALESELDTVRLRMRTTA